ncbi:Oidioi.mRNA.OKI2018_I69.PAR.g11892.t1.cds [Oikopleura dioica]|uniref:Oidioi.mRNA.OKI2018_I69.PAR.g11892.t1.cds n=1 Tax=Oikopleura dioica TaxID=34765 RepID=A0ABN7S1A9_OIKDI|nr:Oidioi.mRNA.OKI2018_I69.PAR.g11892.t1.cds [Oikopleura dioica]
MPHLKHLLGLFLVAVGGAYAECTAGKYGRDGCNLCGACLGGAECDYDTGICWDDTAEQKACAEGYNGKMCNEPVCPGGCGDGICAGPDKCVCPELLAERKNELGQSTCYSLRADGLKGAGVALLVLIASIFSCRLVHAMNH